MVAVDGPKTYGHRNGRYPASSHEHSSVFQLAIEGTRFGTFSFVKHKEIRPGLVLLFCVKHAPKITPLWDDGLLQIVLGAST